MTIHIRSETTADRESIRRVNQAAFGQNAEAELVDALREQGFVRLSLVAEVQGNVVGHILFNALEIVCDDKTIKALSLAPMAVLPEHQRTGIGSQLVREGLNRCREAGHCVVLVVGHSDYYPRFGFSHELAKPLHSPYAGEAFMAMELAPGALNGVEGEVKYPPPFVAV